MRTVILPTETGQGWMRPLLHQVGVTYEKRGCLSWRGSWLSFPSTAGAQARQTAGSVTGSQLLSPPNSASERASKHGSLTEERGPLSELQALADTPEASGDFCRLPGGLEETLSVPLPNFLKEQWKRRCCLPAGEAGRDVVVISLGEVRQSACGWEAGSLVGQAS